MKTSEVSVAAETEQDQPDDILELTKALILAAIIALTIRSFFLEPFNIPSGSMLPTLQVGDYLFVEKYSYGYSRFSFPLDAVPLTKRLLFTAPKRGDVAVFRHPQNTQIDYIKRIIGLPGDKIQMRGGRLYINGEPVTRDFQAREQDRENGVYSNYAKYIETLPDTSVKHYIYEISDLERFDNTTTYTVPEGHYFAMGDNRDGSLDSRAIDDVGFVPEENLIGKAWFIFFSIQHQSQSCTAGEGPLGTLKTWWCEARMLPQSIRYNRIFKRVSSL